MTNLKPSDSKRNDRSKRLVYIIATKWTVSNKIVRLLTLKVLLLYPKIIVSSEDEFLKITKKYAMIPNDHQIKKYAFENGCGLLVTVIKTLDASETSEERQKEKSRFEKEFKKTDTKLNDLVSKHDGELNQVMQLFSQVSSQVTIARDKIHTVKENLHSCKRLLRCRREELKKLWVDALQQKFVLEMLEQINDLRKVPQLVQMYTSKKHYLHATKTLTKAIELNDGPLRSVEGLVDLRNELENHRNQLYNKMIEELNKHLYTTSSLEVLTNFQREGSARNSSFASPFQRNIIRRSAERAEVNTKIRKVLFEMAQRSDVDTTEMLENTDLLDPDLNATYFLGIIIECIALLNKVPESLETIKTQIQCELSAVVTRTTQHLVTMNSTLVIEANGDKTVVHPLLELIELTYKQFKLIADAHSMLLKNYLSVTQRHSIVTNLYDISDYWIQVQTVFQLLLTDYLQIQNATNDEQSEPSFTEQTNNINSFFSRRKIHTKKTLFKFDKASATHYDAEASVKEHKRNLSDMSNDETLLLFSTSKNEQKIREKSLVCDPNPSLIRILYLPLVKYIREIEILLKNKSNQGSTLSTFLSSHIKDSFLAKGHNRTLQVTIEALSKNHDAWRAIISSEEIKSLGLTRPLLQSTVLFENRITETRNLIHDLPDYSEDLLKMVCSLLKTYRETCQAAYRGIVQPETEDKRIYSVAWLKDDDITRFLKTLPNWTDLKTSSQKNKFGGRKTIKASAYNNSEEESPTQIQQRNIREAEMLTSNLGEGGISQQEILSDVSVLKELAILQESMEWFANRIYEFTNDLRKPIVKSTQTTNGDEFPNTQPVSIKDGTIKVLTNLALEFEDLANTCLLVLHLEVRVQCFHYLKANPLDKFNNSNSNKSGSMEPDVKVLKFTKVLSEMDEALISTLHPRKTKYIFEGLAHLAARILINASNYMEKIDEAGVQRMCHNANALQQTLSSITASREVALDHARNFYEMLYMTPEEILTTIIERGSQYSELQYLNALQLSCRKKGIQDSNALATYQQRLSDILGTKATLGVVI